MSTEQDIPYGYCHCGCGEKTQIAKGNRAARGWVKGEPKRFIAGHQTRSAPNQYEVDSETGCWNWMWNRQREGYGRIHLPDGSKPQAHRVYYERHKGPIPKGFDIDHLCRNRRCVNPEHLEAVTRAENLRRGSRAKLNIEQVKEIRASSVRSGLLAERYGVSRETIISVRNGTTWA